MRKLATALLLLVSASAFVAPRQADAGGFNTRPPVHFHGGFRPIYVPPPPVLFFNSQIEYRWPGGYYRSSFGPQFYPYQPMPYGCGPWGY